MYNGICVYQHTVCDVGSVGTCSSFSSLISFSWLSSSSDELSLILLMLNFKSPALMSSSFLNLFFTATNDEWIIKTKLVHSEKLVY